MEIMVKENTVTSEQAEINELISALIIILSLSIASLLRYNHYTRKILLGDF